MCGRHDGLPVNKGATTLVFGYFDMNLVGKLSISGALTAYDTALGRLNGAAADWRGRKRLDGRLVVEYILNLASYTYHPLDVGCSGCWSPS